MSIRPGAFDEEAANAAISGLGDPSLPYGISGRTFAGHEAEVSHELARVVEPRDIADLSHKVSGA